MLTGNDETGLPEKEISPRKHIVVVGIGYVGLPAAIMLARAGHQVTGYDINQALVDDINNGVMRHINEQELHDLLQDERVKQNLRAQGEPCRADAYMIAVPTPLDHRKKIADLTYVTSAVESLLPYLRKGNLVIVESTVPPLTCREVVTPLIEKTGLRVGEDILLAHCPERILPGKIFYEIVHNDRIIGGTTREASEAAREIYASFVKGNLYLTDDVTAELCKLMENTYRDVNIALANELAAVADTLGVDIKQAIDLANKHPRVNLLKPGIGVGGHCIPIDPWFIKEVDPANSQLIFTARTINDDMPSRVAAKIRRAVRGIPSPKIVAIGATYKPDTNDLRESPALQVVELLREDGCNVALYDPIAPEYHCNSVYDVAAGADCLVILIEHEVVRKELAEREDEIKAIMARPLIVRF